jgi:hypothetical protein
MRRTTLLLLLLTTACFTDDDGDRPVGEAGSALWEELDEEDLDAGDRDLG